MEGIRKIQSRPYLLKYVIMYVLMFVESVHLINIPTMEICWHKKDSFLGHSVLFAYYCLLRECLYSRT